MMPDALFLYIISCYIAGLVVEYFDFFPNFYTAVSSMLKKNGTLESTFVIELQVNLAIC